MTTTKHLAEMLLDIKFRGPRDRFREKHPFSDEILATNAVLFHPGYPRLRKIREKQQGHTFVFPKPVTPCNTSYLWRSN